MPTVTCWKIQKGKPSIDSEFLLSEMLDSIGKFTSCLLITDLSPHFRFPDLSMKILTSLEGIAGSILNGGDWLKLTLLSSKILSDTSKYTRFITVQKEDRFYLKILYIPKIEKQNTILGMQRSGRSPVCVLRGCSGTYFKVTRHDVVLKGYKASCSHDWVPGTLVRRMWQFVENWMGICQALLLDLKVQMLAWMGKLLCHQFYSLFFGFGTAFLHGILQSICLQYQWRQAEHKPSCGQ